MCISLFVRERQPLFTRSDISFTQGQQSSCINGSDVMVGNEARERNDKYFDEQHIQQYFHTLRQVT